MRRTELPSAVGYLLAVLVTGAAVTLRWLVDPWLGALQPFATIYAALAIIVSMAGYRAAILATLIGYVACDYLFVVPHGSIHFERFVSLALHLLTSGIVIGFGEGYRRAHNYARALAEARSKELKGSEERFRLLVEGAKEYALFLLDTTGRISTWNPGAERTYGYKTEEVVGRPYTIFFPPADVAAGKPEQALRMAAGEGKHEEEGWRVRKDGSRFCAAVLCYPIYDDDGRLEGFAKLVRDVSERKAAEERERLLLRAEEQRRAAEHYAAIIERQKEELRITLASIGDAVIATDAEGKITLINAVAEKLTGWSADEAIGRPLEQVFSIINEYTRRPVDNPIAKVMASRRIIGLANHTSLISRDGTERPIDDSAAPVKDVDGNLRGAIMVFRDVVERRRTERELLESHARKAAMIETALDCIICMDAQGNVTEFNAAAERTFGYRREEVIGREMAQFIIPARLRDRHRAGLRHYLSSGESIILHRRIEMPALKADGTEVTVELAITQVPGNGSGVPEFIGFLRDITERKHYELELEEANRRKDVFLATLAHELRNPLAPIRNALEVLSAKIPSDPGAKWSQEVIDRQLGHMVRLLDDLLDVSRIVYGKLELRKTPVDLVSVVRDAVETVQPMIDEAGHHLAVEFPPGRISLEADPMRLAQVISNLLNNSAKYTPGGGHIRLRADQQNDGIVITIKDDGIGISSDMLPKIFETFSQAEPTLRRSRGGLGIGLSLVRGLVELHGGRVEAHSAGPGKGAEFTVHLPILRTGATLTENAETKTDGRASLAKRRVLVVDDLKDSADSLALLLGMLGQEAHKAYDGYEAIDLAERIRPDVILLDLGMPKLDGYEVCRRIRQQPWGQTVFVAALTGWGQEEARRQSEESGFDAHLVKPVAIDKLKALLGDIGH